MTAYDDAVQTLYQAAFGDFVAERKRLAMELKTQGDKDGAAQLGKLQRPPVSAWVVNQLWWRKRESFEALLALAARVTASDRDAAKQHREALAGLRDDAARILQEQGNAATETTLRRVTTTLSAIAAAGGFAPDAPGMLSADRDPPGFEALGFATSTASAPAPKPAPTTAKDDAAEKAEQRRREAEQRRAEEEERKRRLAERERLSTALRDAQKLQATQQHELGRLRQEADAAEQSLKETQALLARLQAELASL